MFLGEALQIKKNGDMDNQTSIRTKVLISTGILFFFIVIALTSAFYIKTYRSIRQFEIENAGMNIQKLVHEISVIRTNLGSLCNDWSAWDDTFNFISGVNQEYIDANLNNETLSNLKVNIVIYLDERSKIVKTFFFNPFTEKTEHFPEKLQSLVINEKKLLKHDTLDSHAESFILYSDMPLVLVSRPVRKSDYSGPIRGTLIFGRIFTDRLITEIGNNININLSVIPSLHTPESGEDDEFVSIDWNGSGKPDSSFISMKKNDVINAWVFEKDSSDKNIFAFFLSIPRDFSRKIISDIVIYFIFVLIAASVSVFLILFFLDRAVLSPLFRISGDAREIASRADFSMRVEIAKGKEFGILSKSLNEMIASLEHYHLMHIRDMDALMESEAYLASLLDSIDCGVIAADASDRLIMNINNTGETMTGYSREEIVGMDYNEIITGNDETRPYEGGECAGLMKCEGFIIKKNRAVIPVLKSSIIFKRKDRDALIITFVDTSILKNAESAIRQNEAKYREFFEQDLTGDFISDLDGNILDCNSSFARIFGFDSVAEIVSGHALDFYFVEQTRQQLVDALKREHQLKGVKWVMKKNNGSIVHVIGNIIGVFDDQGELVGIRGYLYDETDRIILERALRHVYKMEAIGTLAGGIAHDFNNILSAILGQAELAMITAETGHDLVERLEKIIASTKRARELVIKLLTFSSKNVEPKHVISLASVVHEAISMIRASVPSVIEIKTEINSASGIRADSNQIHQIVMNVCINSIEAMAKDANGIIEISLDDVFLEKDNGIMLGYGDYIRLSVSDTGHGMTPDTVDRIFDPFFTTKQLSGNTGMGLSVIHGIVKSLNGGIVVKSEPGEGSVFEIYLPRLEESFIEKENRNLAMQAPDTSCMTAFLQQIEGLSDTYKEADKPSYQNKDALEPVKKDPAVLIVEDEPIILEMLSEMVRHMGFMPVARQNPVEALEYFRSEPGAVDIVMTDLSMPEMGGDRLAEEIFNISPDTPVIICSGYSGKKYAEESNLRGPRIFLKKPIVSGVLFKTLNELRDDYTG